MCRARSHELTKKNICLSIVYSGVGWMRDVVRGLPLDVLGVAPARHHSWGNDRQAAE